MSESISTEMVVAPKKAPVLVSFDTGTKRMATVALTGTDDDGNVISITDPDTETVMEVELYWPDHPAVLRARLLFRNALMRIEAMQATTSAAEQIEAQLEMNNLYTAYMATAVASWSYAKVPASIETVTALIVRAPIVRDIITVAMGDAESFLTESLRNFVPASPPLSEGA